MISGCWEDIAFLQLIHDKADFLLEGPGQSSPVCCFKLHDPIAGCEYFLLEHKLPYLFCEVHLVADPFLESTLDLASAVFAVDYRVDDEEEFGVAEQEGDFGVDVVEGGVEMLLLELRINIVVPISDTRQCS